MKKILILIIIVICYYLLYWGEIFNHECKHHKPKWRGIPSEISEVLKEFKDQLQHYEIKVISDEKDYWQIPEETETIENGKIILTGDCEDFTIWVAKKFLDSEFDIRPIFGIAYIDGEAIGHIWLRIEIITGLTTKEIIDIDLEREPKVFPAIMEVPVPREVEKKFWEKVQGIK